MSLGRPQILFPLFADLTGLPGIGAKTARLFERIDVTRPVDLLLTLPYGVEDRRLRDTLFGIESGETATVIVDVLEHRPGRTASRPHRIVVEGGGVQFELIYFHAKRAWLERTYPPGGRRVVSGRVEFYDGGLQMPHPDHVLPEAEADTLPGWEPIYPLTQGLTQRTVARAVAGCPGTATGSAGMDCPGGAFRPRLARLVDRHPDRPCARGSRSPVAGQSRAPASGL